MPVTAPERLRSSRDIADVFAARTRRAGRHVVVHVRPTTAEEPTRVAFVASRRVGNAVRRNRAKRLLREAARPLRWRAGYDVVLVARASAASVGMREVADDLAAVAGALDLVEPTP